MSASQRDKSQQASSSGQSWFSGTSWAPSPAPDLGLRKPAACSEPTRRPALEAAACPGPCFGTCSRTCSEAVSEALCGNNRTTASAQSGAFPYAAQSGCADQLLRDRLTTCVVFRLKIEWFILVFRLCAKNKHIYLYPHMMCMSNSPRPPGPLQKLLGHDLGFRRLPPGSVGGPNGATGGPNGFAQ